MKLRPHLPHVIFGLVFLVILVGKPVAAQLQEAEVPPKAYRLKIVLRVKAETATLTRISATCPIPTNWPEQTTRLISETKPPGCRVREKLVHGMGTLLVAESPKLMKGGTLEIERVYEITRKPVVIRLDSAAWKRPARLTQELRGSLQTSPGIEFADREIKELTDALGKSQKRPCDFAESASKWIRQNVRYKTGAYQGAKSAFRNRTGDCEDMSALFIALCRAAEIPARTVWVEGHAYPEFYLEDEKGRGNWIPVPLLGPEALGSIHETRPILQKGDRYRDATTKQTFRYLPQQAIAFGGQATLTVSRTILAAKPGE